MNAADRSVLIEAESFANLGGWVVDAQHMDQMGSPYLLAHGMGVPVEDAETEVQLPAPGRYHVWVRTRDWAAPWGSGHSPGQFEISVRDCSAGVVFGTSGSDWHWQYGGDVWLPEAHTIVILHDLTGFDGRCDAILLTADASFRPPDDGEALVRLRRELLGLPDAPVDGGLFDLVVVGGGVAGICAALAASRRGLKVALIHDRPVLGGCSSSEIGIPFSGERGAARFPALGTIVAELEGGVRGMGNDAHKLALVTGAPDLTLCLNQHAISADHDDAGIAAVVAQDTRTGAEIRYRGRLFADCTGDGSVGALAGAAYRMGREPQAETGEPLAPEAPDLQILGSTLAWTSVAEPHASSFPDCPWALPFDEASCQHALEGAWNWETGFFRDPIADAERIRDGMLRAIYGNWAFQKNRSSRRAEYAARRLASVGTVLGKRESRRLLGDVVYSQHDILAQRAYPDGIVPSTWGIDLHVPDPANLAHFPGEAFRSVAHHELKAQHPVCAMPYRCFISQTIPNLLMAGRDVSQTHIAHAMFRTQRTTGMMGEVVGVAAALCVALDTSPRGLYAEHLDRLLEALG